MVKYLFTFIKLDNDIIIYWHANQKMIQQLKWNKQQEQKLVSLYVMKHPIAFYL